jgi:hypothetical protein
MKDEVSVISTVTRPVYFHFDNWDGLCLSLAEKKKSPTYQNLRYPLVLMHNDYKEKRDDKVTQATVTGLKLYIICQSSITGLTINPETYTTQQRYDSIYQLVLNPIYDDLLLQMKKSNNFEKEFMRIPHEKKDLFKLWVGDKMNRLPDNLDAIEISFGELIYNLNKFS